MNMNLSSSAPILLSAAVALALSGCAEKRSCSTTPAVVKAPKVISVTDNKDAQIAALQAAIAEARSKTRTIVKEVTGEGSMYPPNAEPGKCYARVLTPAKYEVQTEKVLSKDASERLRVIPAKYTWTTKKVLIKEASERLVAVPATYETITQKVLVSPASERLVSTPAEYTTVTEKVLIKAAHTGWKQGRGPIEKLDNATCEIMCLVNVPAVYKTITRRVVKVPASTKSVPVPAVYKTITKRVLLTPASTKSVPIPASYKTIKVKELVEPASVIRTAIPEQYRTVSKKIKVSEAVLKWQPVLCKSSTTRVNIRSVQQALKEAGFNPGPIDGIMGWRTKSALNKYQKVNGLSSGALTKETLGALGL